MPETCSSIDARLMDFLYGELHAGQQRAIEAHLQGCRSCREKVARYRETRALFARLPEVRPSPAVTVHILQEARQLKPAGEQAAPSWLATLFPRWMLAPALGAATAVLLVAGVVILLQSDRPPERVRQLEEGGHAAAPAATVVAEKAGRQGVPQRGDEAAEGVAAAGAVAAGAAAGAIGEEEAKGEATARGPVMKVTRAQPSDKDEEVASRVAATEVAARSLLTASARPVSSSEVAAPGVPSGLAGGTMAGDAPAGVDRLVAISRPAVGQPALTPDDDAWSWPGKRGTIRTPRDVQEPRHAGSGRAAADADGASLDLERRRKGGKWGGEGLDGEPALARRTDAAPPAGELQAQAPARPARAAAAPQAAAPSTRTIAEPDHLPGVPEQKQARLADEGYWKQPAGKKEQAVERPASGQAGQAAPPALAAPQPLRWAAPPPAGLAPAAVKPAPAPAPAPAEAQAPAPAAAPAPTPAGRSHSSSLGDLLRAPEPQQPAGSLPWSDSSVAPPASVAAAPGKPYAPPPPAAPSGGLLLPSAGGSPEQESSGLAEDGRRAFAALAPELSRGGGSAGNIGPPAAREQQKTVKAKAQLEEAVAPADEGGTPDSSRELLRTSSDRLEQGKYAEAYAGYAALLRQGDPRWQEQARYGTARSLELLGQAAEASQAYEGLLRHHPATAHLKQVLLSLARLYEQLGQAERAQQSLQRYLERWPADREAQLALRRVARSLTGKAGAGGGAARAAEAGVAAPAAAAPPQPPARVLDDAADAETAPATLPAAVE